MQPATCTSPSSSTGNGGRGGEEIMIFGVRVVVDSLRKSVSMNNLSQYEQPHEPNNNNNNNKNKGDQSATAGYASADDVVPHTIGNRERKRGVPWTEEEHKLFVIGLQKVGKGDWRGISRNFVKTRTPTQVASHAQKYFLRRTNLNRRRRRSSLFDITTDTVAAIPMDQEQVHQQEKPTDQPAMVPAVFSMTLNPLVQSVPIENPMENMTLLQGNKLIPQSSDLDLNLNLNAVNDPSPLSLNLSLQLNQMDSSSSSSSSSRHSAFHVLPSLIRNGDSNSIIRVA